MLKVSVSGVRGIWGKGLNPETIIAYTKAFATFVYKQNSSVSEPSIVIGSDTRPTSFAFKGIVSSTLQSFGIHVIDLGVLATPLVLFAVRTLKVQGGIVITASHNPLEWNAFKFANSQGLFLNKEDMKNIEDAVIANNYGLNMHYTKIGTYKSERSIIDKYLDFVLPHFQLDSIKQSGITIIADVINGTATEFFPILMQYLSLEYSIIHADPKKAFERPAEPKADHLNALSNKVKERKASIGLAFDPDGDRLALVDEQGIPVGENWTCTIAYLCYCEVHKPINKDIAVNLSTSMLIDKVAKKFDAKVIRTPVGEINVTEVLLKNNISFGGEGNGGVIFPKLNPCRDSIIAILFILEYLAITKKNLSQIITEFTIPSMINTFKEIDKPLYIDQLQNSVMELCKSFNLQNISIDTQDGFRIAYDSGWIQIRTSNTEPIIRIMGESFNQTQQEDLLTAILNLF